MDLQTPLIVPDDVRALIRFLDQQGTFYFPTLANGLFSAANATHDDFAASGYQNIWIRDNVHIAHAHYVLGDCLAATRAITAILEFHRGQSTAIEDLIVGRTSGADPMQRPHIRFDGRTLTPLSEQWAHAQNDALGYLIWLTSRLIGDGWLKPSPDEVATLGNLVQVLTTLRYWQDEDSGHWEEARKIEASSIGAVVAALRELRRVVRETSWGDDFAKLPRPIDEAVLTQLITPGEQALDRILPNECIQPDKERKYDGALLFLLYPLEAVDLFAPAADSILRQTRTHLQGEHGIRRYLGDSYWCADFRTLLSAETRTADFSDDMSSRDALLKPGQEAQWCIFDPIVSVIYGRRYSQTSDRRWLELQKEYLQR
ncbi:MAG: glycoside hydrolase family 15 protein, partial [Planctomycetaceae bacterium]